MRVEAMPRASLQAGIPWNWTTHGEYLSALERKPLGLNVATLIDHCAVRQHAMGDPDPAGIGSDRGFFGLPFYNIESVHVVDEHTLLLASDNNFPFSNGRARSRSVDRTGPLVADDTELVLVGLGTPLEVDRRLLPADAR